MNSKVVGYQVVAEHDIGALNNSVEDLLKLGWQPLGGVAVVAPLVNDSPAPLYAQSMVLFADSSEAIG
jgi:hypothetical protein